MLSYEGLQDVLTATLVVAVVAVVVAAAWLSTSVREQPLVATAVVVFHSRDTVVGGSGGSGNGDVSVVETQGGEGEAAATPAEEKDGEATSYPREGGMEVKEVPQETSPDRTRESGETVGQWANTNATEVAGDGGESGPGEAAAGVRSDEGQCIGPRPEGSPKGGPSDAPHPPQADCTQEEVPEMEVRRRRLQHFVSMGGAAGSTMEEIQVSTQEEAEEVSSEEGPVVGQEDRLPTTPIATTHTDIPTNHTREQEQQEKEGDVEVEKKEEEAETTEQGIEETRPPGSIKIRLKFLDETQRHVFAQLTEKVGTFKRQHFSIELDANRRIRLIFNGQLLSRDSSTLAQYGLFDNCVVHCHVSQPQLLPRPPGHSGEAAAQEEEDAYVSRLLAPLLYAVMVVMWYLRYEYGHLFNTMSTIILLFLTALLLISTYLLYITQHVPQGSAATTHIPVTGRTIAHAPSSSSTSTVPSPSTSS